MTEPSESNRGERSSHRPLLATDRDTRTLTVVLSDADWQALRRLEPDPVGWLRTQVRERLRADSRDETRAGDNLRSPRSGD